MDDDVERLEELGPVLNMRTRGKRVKVKLEDEEGELGYMSSGGSSEYGDAGDGDLDTEDDFDDLPLAKNKKLLPSKKKRADASSTAKVAEEGLGTVIGDHHNTSLLDAPSDPTVGSLFHTPGLKLEPSSGLENGTTDRM